MSRLSAFLYSCLIYFFIVFSIVVLSLIFKNNVVNYGNDVVDILFIEENDIKDNKQQKQDYTKEPDKVEKKESKKSEQKIEKKEQKTEKVEQKVEKVVETKNDTALDDLFNDLNIGDMKPKKEVSKKTTKSKSQSNNTQDQSSQDKNDSKSTTVKSNNNSETAKTSARVSGMYDEYFGRVNAYLKNIWTLVISGESGIDDKEIFEISFKISKDGIIKIDDSKFIENTMLRKKARVFVNMVNEQNKNLGIPPNQKDYNGVLRLSVVLNIKEIK